MMTSENEKWIKIGDVGVDSGQLMIVDPCYLSDWEGTEYLEEKVVDDSFSYNGCCRKGGKPSKNFNYENGNPGRAVVFNSGYGDGLYEVWARLEDGSIAEIRIVMID